MSHELLPPPGGALGVLTLALLLGSRHALDPDHLAAVSQIVLGDRRRGLRSPMLVGLWWGIGHALTLCALGLPVVVWGRALPPAVHLGGELAVGLLIVGLGLRLLKRSAEGRLAPVPVPVSSVAIGGGDGDEPVARSNGIAMRPVDAPVARTPLMAFGVGLVHGVGGSAAVGVLAVASSTGPAALGTLLLFSAATALSMSGSALAFGYLVARGPLGVRIEGLLPLLAWAGVAFGLFYTAGVLRQALGGG